MFTGLVEATGTLRSAQASGTGARLVLTTPNWDLRLGESIAVDGVCLTVAALGSGGFEADISHETITRTTLGTLTPGAELNLERSLCVGDRLGGHLVTGHVDAVSVVESLTRIERSLCLQVTVDPTLAYLVAEKGSVALNGVSLTVNAVSKQSLTVMLIPHTLEATNLKRVDVGTRLNLEVDLVARYVARWQAVPSPELASGSVASNPPTLLTALRQAGFTND